MVSLEGRGDGPRDSIDHKTNKAVSSASHYLNAADLKFNDIIMMRERATSIALTQNKTMPVASCWISRQ